MNMLESGWGGDCFFSATPPQSGTNAQLYIKNETKYTVYSLTGHSETRVDHCLANVCTRHTPTHIHMHSLLWSRTVLWISSAGNPEDPEEHSRVCTVCLRHSMVKHYPAQHSSPTFLSASPTVASLVSQETRDRWGRRDGYITLYRNMTNDWGRERHHFSKFSIFSHTAHTVQSMALRLFFSINNMWMVFVTCAFWCIL